MGKVREIVGAAARFAGRKITSRGPDQTWQQQAWSFYGDGDTPEVGFAANWVGNGLSRCKLFGGRKLPGGDIEEVDEDHPVAEIVRQIAGGPLGQSQLLGEFGPHLVVAGEGWIIVRDGGRDWRVVSVQEVTVRSDYLEVEVGDEKVKVPAADPDDGIDKDTPVAIRVWDPHPRRYIEADSPVRRSLSLLNELRLLNAAVAAIARSQLTGRGALLVPQGTRFPPAPGQQQNAPQDDLLEVFMQVAETAYHEPDSAAATVPIVLEVPPEAAGQWERITFESEFDELAVKLREEAIRRFAAGADTPAEVLLGLSDANHWNVWALQAEGITLAIEPRLTCIADALTTQWLQPLLAAQDSVEDPEEYVVWWSTAPLRQRSNRPQTAVEVHKLGGINDEALRRETGFDEGDAPTEEERKRELIIQLVTRAPDLAPALLPVIGIEVPGFTTAALPARTRTTGDSADRDGENPGPPDTDPDGDPDPALMAACDALVVRALELAGKRIRSRRPRAERGRLQEIDAAAVHTQIALTAEEIDSLRLLDGAWDRVPAVAARYGVEAGCMEATLDSYVRELLAAGIAHSWDTMPNVMHAPCLMEAA
jgi:hypothetical protein